MIINHGCVEVPIHYHAPMTQPVGFAIAAVFVTGLMTKVADFEVAPKVAVSTTLVCLVTELVLTANVALL